MKYTIKNIKEIAFKKQNNILNVLVAEKFALPQLWLVANFTNLTPNMITAINMLIWIVASIFFSQGYFIIGGLLFFWGHTLDIVDGRLANLKNLNSKFGKFFDSLVDIFGVGIILIGLSYSTGLIKVIALYMIFYLMLQLLYSLMYIANENKLLVEKIDVGGGLRNWLSKRRLRLLYSATDTHLLMFVACPLLTIWFAPFKIFLYGFIITDIMLFSLFILLTIIQAKVLYD